MADERFHLRCGDGDPLGSVSRGHHILRVCTYHITDELVIVWLHQRYIYNSIWLRICKGGCDVHEERRKIIISTYLIMPLNQQGSSANH